MVSVKVSISLSLSQERLRVMSGLFGAAKNLNATTGTWITHGIRVTLCSNSNEKRQCIRSNTFHANCHGLPASDANLFARCSNSVRRSIDLTTQAQRR
jgi:hypothetical protein